MKKVFILIIIILSFLLILLSSLFLYNFSDTKNIEYKDYSNIILDNSSWVNLNKEDFNSLVLKTYSENILAIINSLENSKPIIFEVHGGKFSNENKNNFIVASSFIDSNNIYIYVSLSNNTYEKRITSLEEVLENAVRFFIINDEEVLN